MSTLKVDTIQDTNAVEMYLCKAWVNFNGSGTVAIRASGNVTSITDNGTGDYTINFTNAMTDADYSVCGTTQENRTIGVAYGYVGSPLTTTSARVVTTLTNGSYTVSDPSGVFISVFR
jgi:hypothetical protein